MMTRHCLSGEEVERRAQELYEKTIRSTVEPGNKGKIVVINVETEEHEVDNTILAASRSALAKHPDAALWALRIGYDAVYSFDGSLEPASRPQ